MTYGDLRYTIEANFRGPCPKPLKLQEKLSPLDEHRFISEARFVTSHPLPFNNRSLRVTERSSIFHCQPYSGYLYLSYHSVALFSPRAVHDPKSGDARPHPSKPTKVITNIPIIAQPPDYEQKTCGACYIIIVTSLT